MLLPGRGEGSTTGIINKMGAGASSNVPTGAFDAMKAEYMRLKDTGMSDEGK